MLRILLLLFELNYAFTFGYIIEDDLQIYELSTGKICFFSEFDMELLVMKRLFIRGGVRTNFFKDKDWLDYEPYEIKFDISTGINFDFIEIGFSHFCVHPIKTFHNDHKNYPKIEYEGGRQELYIKFSNVEKD